jgi:hypothetical protein
LLWEGALRTTVTHDQPDLGDRELYPSQTWATLATGVPYRDHGVYWYGDPKPEEHPTYWQLAARAGRTVGIVGTLHSSPLREQANDPNIVFAIPDCFAADADTTPRRLRGFQRLNLAMTRGSGRVVSVRPGLRDLATLATSWRIGVKGRSLTTLGKLAAGVATKRVPRERLRAAQFVMQADIFQTLVWEHDPDLAVLFTNHVASMMHRYWYATFPGDWPEAVYDDAWIARYGDEIRFAMSLLDRTIAELRTYCEATGRALVVVSSMGQVADHAHDDASRRESVIVRNADHFVATISETHIAVRPGMVPQISVEYPSAEAAIAARAAIDDAELDGLRLFVDRAGPVLTVTYDIDPRARRIVVDGRAWSFADAGLDVQRIDDHRTGTHDPMGSWISHGADIDVDADGEPIDVLEIAPTILDLLGVEPAPYHRTSRLRVTAASRS